MKKYILLSTLLCAFGAKAQIANNDFETWQTDTSYLAEGEISDLPADTSVYLDPEFWTTSNILTNLDSLGNRSLVTQSSNAYSGTSAIQMITDTIHVPPISSLPINHITLPGFAVNGFFHVTDIHLSSTAVISPASIPGAGQPISQRLASISGYFNYTPVYNTLTHANDTCIIWGTLRKGDTVVADAIFKSADTTGGYQHFSADFVYYSCEMPDTFVMLMASSIPNPYSMAGFTNPLQPGSVLLVDGVSYDVLPTNYAFAPFATNDVNTIPKNVTSTINVLANDDDCANLPLTVTVVTQPNHGTASVTADNQIAYTPDSSYVGLDTVKYKDTNTNGDTAVALCVVYVSNTTGIGNIHEIAVVIYPNPANDVLNIEVGEKADIQIIDINGRLMLADAVVANEKKTISTAILPSGVYFLKVFGDRTVTTKQIVIVK